MKPVFALMLTALVSLTTLLPLQVQAAEFVQFQALREHVDGPW